MFGIHFAAVQLVVSLKAYQEEARIFDELCKSLPPDVVVALREARKKRQEEALQHQKNLEVAREGRSLNFWGNR